MISFEKKFLFVHVPKTGGNSLQNILKHYSEDKISCPREHMDGKERFAVRNEKYGVGKHATLSRYRSVMEPKKFAALYKFATIRNPWDLVVSMYFSPHKGIHEWNRDHFKEVINTTHTLRHYIYCSAKVEHLFVKVGLSGKRNEIDRDVDFLIRFENIQEDFDIVCEKLDIPKTNLPHSNASKRKHYSEYYDEELRQLVAEKFSEEIEVGNYQFEKL